MRRNVLAALALSGAFVVPATLVTTALAATPETAIAGRPSDDQVQGGYESLASCQSALPDIQRQQSSTETSLVCQSYAGSSSTMWGIYRAPSSNEESSTTESQ